MNLPQREYIYGKKPCVTKISQTYITKLIQMCMPLSMLLYNVKQNMTKMCTFLKQKYDILWKKMNFVENKIWKLWKNHHEWSLKKDVHFWKQKYEHLWKSEFVKTKSFIHHTIYVINTFFFWNIAYHCYNTVTTHYDKKPSLVNFSLWMKFLLSRNFVR